MKNKSLKKPFFANFLEDQTKEIKSVKGGKSDANAQTSRLLDSWTSPSKDNPVTMKWPSDGDDHVAI